MEDKNNSCSRLRIAGEVLFALAVTTIVQELFLSSADGVWPMVLCGFVCVLSFVLLHCLINTIKAMKDPDVIAASSLNMSVLNYQKYREWYDKYDALMKQYGVDSKEAEAYFLSFFKQIKNPNEWRRYQNFRFEESRRKLREMLDNYD